MSTNLPPGAMPRFPGLRQPESIILATWLKDHASEYDKLEYNVGVGPGHDIGPEHTDAMREGMKFNSQHKIDCIAWSGAHATIIEVKERAGFSTVGQIQGYQHLWLNENVGQWPPSMIILTARPVNGVQGFAASKGVAVVVVAADFSGITSSV